MNELFEIAAVSDKSKVKSSSIEEFKGMRLCTVKRFCDLEYAFL